MSGDLKFSPATHQDMPAIFEQAKALVDRYEDQSLIDYPKVIAWMGRKIERNLADYTCVYNRDCKAAYYALRKCEDGYELDDFYVLPQYRGQGIGTKILEKCLADAQHQLFVYVFKSNSGAIALYKRHGFEIIEQVSPTRIIMRCRS